MFKLRYSHLQRYKQLIPLIFQSEVITNKYITAFAMTIKKSVVFVVKGDIAMSIVTGYKFRYKPRTGKD